MFGSDGSPIIQYVVIFAIIFAALAAIVLVVRPLTGRGLALAGRAGGRGRQPRLGIVDVYELDRARQLILLRRDNVEHLLLVGGPNDVVVERNIQRGQRPLPEAALRPSEAVAVPATGPLAEPLPDPLAGAGRLPEPPRPIPEIAGRRPEPVFEMPVVVPPPVPRSGAAPPVTLPLDAALIGGDEPGQDLLTQDLSDRALPAGETARAAPQPRREPLSPRRPLQRTSPPLLDPRPEPASARAGQGAPDQAAPDRAADGTAAPAGPPVPQLAVRGERRAVDPAILSDMARQLQAALARPASAVAPAPAATPPAAGPAVDPVAAAMASVQAAPEPPAPPAAPPVAEPPRAAPVPPAPPAPAAPRVQPPAPKVATPPAPPPPEPAPAGNPFSVEEIEAEFARLLGRPLDKQG